MEGGINTGLLIKHAKSVSSVAGGLGGGGHCLHFFLLCSLIENLLVL